MARGGRGLGGIFGAGLRLASKAAERVMQDPRGQDAVARAVGLAQRGRKRFEEVQERFLEAAGIPGKADYDDLAKRLARLKRKAREIAEKLDGEASGEADDAEETHGNGSSGAH